MKKIGFFCGYYLPHLGGVERYISKLSEKLNKLGYEIIIVTTLHNEKLKTYEKTDAYTIYRLPTHKIAKDRYPIPKHDKRYKALIEELRKEEIDHYILNTRFHLTSLIGARMGKQYKKPVMLIEHGTGHFTVNNQFLDYIGKWYEHLLTLVIKRYVDRFYGVSKGCNNWLRHFHINASGVFYNSIEVDSKKIATDYYENRYNTNEVVVTYAGRLIKEKGILNLIEAFLLVKKKNEEVPMRLTIAGDGDLLESIKKKYRNQSIDILGRLDFEQVMSLFKRSDIFVYPSLYPEGLPTSILEAGLMGCAVVATPRGGTGEVIIGRQHGIIVDGSVEDLQIALEQLVQNKQKREKVAFAIQQRVEKVFNWDTTARMVDTEIKTLSVK